jgi:hypothetical protein
MMATSTTQAAWRSFGGANDKVTYAGDMLMAAEFYIPSTQQTANTNVQRSATDLSPVVLPPGVVVTSVQIVPAVTGGTTPTLNMGLRDTATSTNVATALTAATPSVATKAVVNQDSATAGTAMGIKQPTTTLQTVTGAITGAPTGGSLVGRILYYVSNGGAATA